MNTRVKWAVATLIGITLVACSLMKTNPDGTQSVDPLVKSAAVASANVVSSLACKQFITGPAILTARPILSQAYNLTLTDPAKALADLQNPGADYAQIAGLVWYGISTGLQAITSPEMWNALELPVAQAALRGCMVSIGVPV